MKIYVLDDELNPPGGYEKRDQLPKVLAGHDLTLALTLEEAKEKFKPPYDLMLLDHDLNGTFNPVGSPNTGLTFIQWMVEQPYNCCPRVKQRIFCNECGYGRSEAMYCSNEDQEGIPHKPPAPLPQIILHSVSQKGRKAMHDILDEYGYHVLEYPFNQKYIEFLKASFSLERTA